MDKELYALMTQINDKVTNVLVDVGGIKEHLKNLNGKVAKNVIDIENNRLSSEKVDDVLKKELEKINLTIAKAIGASMVVVFLINLGINKFLL